MPLPESSPHVRWITSAHRERPDTGEFTTTGLARAARAVPIKAPIPLNSAPRAPLNLAVGQVIRDHRVELNVAQQELGRRIGQSRTSVYSIEQGLRNITVVHLVLLGAALNVPPEAILSQALENLRSTS